jgi:hypothetical protein
MEMDGAPMPLQGTLKSFVAFDSLAKAMEIDGAPLQLRKTL